MPLCPLYSKLPLCKNTQKKCPGREGTALALQPAQVILRFCISWVSLYVPGTEQGVLARAEGAVLPLAPHAALGAVSLEMSSCQVKHKSDSL